MSTNLFPQPPKFSPCGSSVPPLLPQKFRAVALLTPFDDSQLVVVEITYDWSVRIMRVTAYGLEEGYGDFLYTPDGYYILDSVNGGPPVNIFGPIATTEQVPAPTFLSDIGATCNGMQEVLGVVTNWWCALRMNTNPPAPIPPDPTPHIAANWFWMRNDNQYPWRMMFINTTNDFKLPFIGRFAFVHFPTFEAITSTNLPALLQSAGEYGKKVDSTNAALLQKEKTLETYNLLENKTFLSRTVERLKILGRIQELIPGLTPPDNNPLPTWSPRQFMTALTTPTFEPHPFPNQPYPTQIFYDWKIQRQLTRFFLPDSTMQDIILTNSASYIVLRSPNGKHTCMGKLPVGLPYPNWPERDGGVCKGIITNNPQLSPNKTTQIFTLQSMPPRNFWIWYTTVNEAIMFAEVPQACNVELVLTDYFDFNSTPPPFAPSLFVVPPDCLAVSPQHAAKPETSKLAKKATLKSTKKTLTRKPAKKSTTKKLPKKKRTAKKVSARKPVNKVKTKKPMKKKATVKKTEAHKSVKRTSADKSVKRTTARKPAATKRK